MKPRLLITVRDIAGAAHLAEVARAIAADGRLAFRVAAQAPAAGFLEQAGIRHQRIDLPPAADRNSPAAQDLLEAARALLAAEPVDAVLAGLSTPFDGGIDEAVLAVAEVPTFLLQDFWGEQNTFFGRSAETFLVLDETARERNFRRFGVDSIIVGSARHAPYGTRDLAAIRTEKRQALGMHSAAPVFGYFGQALQRLGGYHRTVAGFIRALEALDRPVSLIVRKHPRETPENFLSTVRLFEASPRLTPVVANEGTVEDCLAACDVVCSLFSNCTYDATFQNYFSPQPLSVPVSLLFDPEIAAYCRERVELESLPLHVNKLVVAIYRDDDLAEELQRCIEPDVRRQVWQRAKAHLADPTHASHRIIEAILARARAKA